MKFSYLAYDQSGGQLTDSVEALDANDAREILSRRGLFVTEINEVGKAKSGPRGGTVPQRAGRKKLANLSMLTRQFYVLISSGTQVVPALSALELQMRDPRWKQVIGSVRARVEQGTSLSEAMDTFPGYFDSVFRSMVSAGEAGGKLAEMLGRLADLTQKRLHVQSSIRGAMAYPVLLVTVA